jgi:hypothetical protein
MQSAWAGVSHLSQQRTADAVLRTRVHRTAKVDDNAEEGEKTEESDRTLPTAFRGCYRKSITGILLVLYLTVPGSVLNEAPLPSRRSKTKQTL